MGVYIGQWLILTVGAVALRATSGFKWKREPRTYVRCYFLGAEADKQLRPHSWQHDFGFSAMKAPVASTWPLAS